MDQGVGECLVLDSVYVLWLLRQSTDSNTPFLQQEPVDTLIMITTIHLSACVESFSAIDTRA